MPHNKMGSFNRVAIRRKERVLETEEAEETGEFLRNAGKPFSLGNNYTIPELLTEIHFTVA